MSVKTLKLNNYRNYTTASFEFDQSLNLIIGKNGIGKTNILESLIVVSNTKSFRTMNDQSLIKENEEYARIEVNADGGNYKVVINKDNKSLFYNGNHIKKTSDFIGKVNCVLFKPSDLELFNQSPKERRKLLDIELGKIFKNYLESLLRYNALLKDKNRLLKEVNPDITYLDSIDEMMVPYIEEVIKEREKFFEFVNNNISFLYQNISGLDSKIKISYRKCCNVSEIKETLAKSREKDFFYHYATVGVHHDDYSFYMDDKEINEVASQGQKRMVLISFKMALAYYIKKMCGNMPIVLLDDVLSELDQTNQKRLLSIFPKETQIIITNTDLPVEINREYKLIDLEGGLYV